VIATGTGTGVTGNTITPTGGVTAADTIIITLPAGTVPATVTFIAADAVVNAATTYRSGGTAAQAAVSIYKSLYANANTLALINSGQLSVSMNAAGNAVQIYQNYAGTAPAISANGVSAPIVIGSNISPNNPGPLTGGLDLSGIRNLDGFIGNGIASTVTVSNYANGTGNANAATNLITNSGFNLPTGTVPAATNAAAILSINIAGRTFTGAVFKGTAAPGGNQPLNNQSFKFTDKATGEFFTVNSLVFDPDMTTSGANVATAIQNLINGSTYAQTRDLSINTDSGNVIVNGGAVASMTGMTAELNATNFANLQFSDFQITAAVNGDLTFTATINNTATGNNVNYTTLIPAANIPTLVQGYGLQLTSTSGNGDVLTLNLGQLGLTSLNQPVNLIPVATAIKNALTNAGSGLNVRTGVDFDDVLVVKMPNVNLTQILVDKNGTYVPTFDVSTVGGQQLADQVLVNAIKYVRTSQAFLKSSGDSVDQASTALENLNQVTQDSADSYTNTDLIATAEGFSASLKALSSSILVLKGGSLIAQQTQDVIRNAVNA
jgi:hypothetical protein